MGTTVAAVLVRGDRAAVAHVGDSRVYLYRDGRLEALTDDHSLLAECLRSGYITPDLAGSFPYKHFVTRSLGAGDSVDVDTAPARAASRATCVLLCSDGLSGVRRRRRDRPEPSAAKPDLEATARSLVDRANDEGGPDNVTVVLVRAGLSSSRPWGRLLRGAAPPAAAVGESSASPGQRYVARGRGSWAAAVARRSARSSSRTGR